MEKANNYPYIIACGETKDKILRYYIEVEKHLICVRTTKHDMLLDFALNFFVVLDAE